MAAHIFTVSEENYKICIERGLVAIPEAKESRSHDNVMDGLLSRLYAIKENDYVLMYTIGSKKLKGVWQVEGVPFYDESPVWQDRVYPFRCKIRYSEYNFANSLDLDDINDLRNSGRIWTWALQRATGTNSVFSISNSEFNILLIEFIKKNPFLFQKQFIPAPYPFHSKNLHEHLHFIDNEPKYEFTVMALLNDAFACEQHKDVFGNYSDFMCYVPTNLGKEMDVMLMFSNPIDPSQVISYDIIEVKRSVFDLAALKQLVGYESWFLQKKVAGDLNMVRSTAIAKHFSDEVIDYVSKRQEIENKPIKLLEYSYSDQRFDLRMVN